MTTVTPSVESPPPLSRTAPRRAWLLVLVVAGLVLALAAGVLIGRLSSTPQDPPGLAGPGVTAMLADRVAAVNEGSAQDIAEFYSDDAILEEFDQQAPVITAGGSAIGSHLSAYALMGLRLQQTGTATQLSSFVAEPLLWSDGYGGIVVYRLAEDGLIAHQWVVGGPIPGSTGP